MARASGEVVLSRYELGEPIGEGTFGCVWSASDKRLGRRVAVKFAKPDRRPQLRREAALLAQLDHENIVRIFDLDPDADEPTLVMEYVEGESLRERMQRDGILPVDEAVRIASFVLGALDHAHGKGILHRDIKPENVLLRTDGAVKLGDFGLGEMTGEEVSLLASRSVLAKGADLSIAGTVSYMAPEQKRGETSLQSDLYAVGVLLYEMLTGRMPEGRFKEPSARNPELSPELNCAILRALEEEPEDRFVTAAAMLGATGGQAAPPRTASVAPAVPPQDDVDLLRRLVAIDGGGPGAHRKLGLALAEAEPVEAERSLRAALNESPEDCEVLRALAVSLSLQGRHDDEAAVCRQLATLRRDAESVAWLTEALVAACEDAIASQRLSDAEVLITELVRLRADATVAGTLAQRLMAQRVAHAAAAVREALRCGREDVAVSGLSVLRDLGAPDALQEELRGLLDEAHAEAAEDCVRAALREGDLASALSGLWRLQACGADAERVSALHSEVAAAAGASLEASIVAGDVEVACGLASQIAAADPEGITGVARTTRDAAWVRALATVERGAGWGELERRFSVLRALGTTEDWAGQATAWAGAWAGQQSADRASIERWLRTARCYPDRGAVVARACASAVCGAASALAWVGMVSLPSGSDASASSTSVPLLVWTAVPLALGALLAGISFMAHFATRRAATAASQALLAIADWPNLRRKPAIGFLAARAAAPSQDPTAAWALKRLIR